MFKIVLGNLWPNFFAGGRNDEKSAAAANGSSVSSRPPPSSIGTSHTADHVTNVTSSVGNDDVIKGGETDDWDGEDDFAETTNILSSRQQQQQQQQPQQQSYLDYPAGMVRFMKYIFCIKHASFGTYNMRLSVNDVMHGECNIFWDTNNITTAKAALCNLSLCQAAYCAHISEFPLTNYHFKNIIG